MRALFDDGTVVEISALDRERSKVLREAADSLGEDEACKLHLQAMQFQLWRADKAVENAADVVHILQVKLHSEQLWCMDTLASPRVVSLNCEWDHDAQSNCAFDSTERFAVQHHTCMWAAAAVSGMHTASSHTTLISRMTSPAHAFLHHGTD